jgi:S1-C subfamily serine protease
MDFLAHLNKQFSSWIILTWVGCWLVQPPIQAFANPNPSPICEQQDGKAVFSIQTASHKMITPIALKPFLSIHQLASAITVKVLSGDTWGSGILLQHKGQVYTVVTNEHVLIAGDRHRIQTPDGQIHSAWVVRGDRFDGNDLGLLQFSSSRQYTLASLGKASTLKLGDELVASGFPVETRNAYPRGFLVTTGQVSLLPNQFLRAGYQIGYTNPIQKGMSGGPVLNLQGQVVGINGRHAYPLWGDPFVFEDGSRPSLELQQRMVELSWAIPVERFVQLAPDFAEPMKQLSISHCYETPTSPSHTAQIQQRQSLW